MKQINQKPFSPNLELQFRLFENFIIKKKINKFKNKSHVNPIYKEQIEEQLELEEKRILREKIFFYFFVFLGLFGLIITLLILIDIFLGNPIYNHFFEQNIINNFYANPKIPNSWT
tara:strand:+ start:331 stop:678 length:348 start_codon:yes stop_codon:yes gene_type:complete